MAAPLMTSTQHTHWIDAARYTQPEPHPLCRQLRQLRKAKGMSLAQFEDRSGIPAVVVGAYERGDRIPPLHKLEAVFQFFGYRLVAVPTDADATRLPTDMVAELRAIADQLEANSTD
jgi:transcriptional regulator with XRE-family HTH domain